jgi:molybdopterin-binding protein
MDILSADEVASLLHLNVKRVQGLAREGKLPASRIGRKWLFPRSRIEALLGHGRAVSEPPMELSARNRLRGRITGLQMDKVMAEVRLAIGEQELTSIITRASAERLRLRVGDEVYAVIKSTEVMIGK